MHLLAVLVIFHKKPQNLFFNTFRGNLYPGELMIECIFFYRPITVGVGGGGGRRIISGEAYSGSLRYFNHRPPNCDLRETPVVLNRGG